MAFPPSSKLLSLSAAPLTSPVHGPEEVHGRPHPPDAISESYLAAQPSLFNTDAFPLCPLCGDVPETFCYAILCCPAEASARARNLQGLSAVDQNAPLWSSSFLLHSLAAFIRATGTTFSPDMFPFLPPSPASMVFPSSPVGPPPVDLLASPPRPL